MDMKRRRRDHSQYVLPILTVLLSHAAREASRPCQSQVVAPATRPLAHSRKTTQLGVIVLEKHDIIHHGGASPSSPLH
jgi:hypothetical protein